MEEMAELARKGCKPSRSGSRALCTYHGNPLETLQLTIPDHYRVLTEHEICATPTAILDLFHGVRVGYHLSPTLTFNTLRNLDTSSPP